jgi:beta-phosphoglucomutase family hydrolase
MHSKQKVKAEPASFRGAVFDLDGVVTQTARLHFKAWKQTFDSFLRRRAGGRPFQPFTREDYRRYVDGRPRYQGVKSFLESRDIELPYGKPADSPELETVCGVGNRKNERFRRLLAREGAEVYESTVAFIRELKRRGVKVGVASSSMNCRDILEQTGLLDLFEAVVGGADAREMGLAGKPEPDIFVVAADHLGLRPDECILFEDALSGVEAGRRGNFALVVGVSREGRRRSLQAYGADIVVADLAELSIGQIDWWFRTGIREDGWNLAWHAFEAGRERLRETLTTVGNGYFATRGAFEGARADGSVHYPGTYIAGVYNRLASEVHGRTVVNNDLVNCPNWLPIEVRIGEGEFVDPLQAGFLRYRHSLDMKSAVMSRTVTFRDEAGRITTIESARFASMDDPHLGAIRCRVTPRNWSGPITFRSALDGTVENGGVARYRDLASRHLAPIRTDADDGRLLLVVRTVASQIRIAVAARHQAYAGQAPAEAERGIDERPGWIAESFTLQARKGQPCGLDKIVSIHTSQPWDAADPPAAALGSLARPQRFEELLDRHRRAWEALWSMADVEIEGDRFAQQVAHLHVYHLLVTASPHNDKIDAGLPARGLHGEAYRGHVFWDELFAYPFYNLRFPQISRALLLYRYRRLGAARRHAREHGYRGAMFPWQSADTGEEETQEIHYNPVSGAWGPDLSRRQRHVSLAVAYNVWEYYYVTGDLEFLHRYGAEMMVEIARFWASIAAFDPGDGRCHIRGVMGPDEFHEKYPDAEEEGVDDNAYTNILAAWILHKTIETVEHLPGEALRRLEESIGFSPQEMEPWRAIVRQMYVEIGPDGVLAQFAGFRKLPELDWERYRKKYADIRRLDRILKAEGDSPDRYQVAKQADALMIFYLLSPGQVKHILQLMGYEIGDEVEFLRRNYEYYVRRTSHGSTLSYMVHAAVLRYLDTHRSDMARWFRAALASDIHDIQGGTTPEGIHTGVMGGTLDMVVKTFAGINLFKDAVRLTPCLPLQWRRLSFRILRRGRGLELEIVPGRPGRVRIEPLAGTGREKVLLAGREHTVTGGRPLELAWPGAPCGPGETEGAA